MAKYQIQNPIQRTFSNVQQSVSRWTSTFVKLFRFIPTRDGTVEPGIKDRSTGKFRTYKNLPSQVQKIWSWWLQENYETKASMAMRKERYSDLDFMVKNDVIISTALNLYADEVVQADTPSGVLTAVSRNSEVANECNRLIHKWGLTQEKLRVIAFDLMKYGDAFTIKSISPTEGITDQTVLDPGDIFDRIEFNATRFNVQKYGQGDQLTRDAKLKGIASFLKNGEASMTEVSEFFKSYLFGFTMSNGLLLPPWMISHFRIQTTQKEIWPFGISDFAHSISTFRQLVSSKNLQGVARTLALPLETFEVSTDPEMTQDEMWEAVQEAKEQYENAGQAGVLRDDMGLNNRVWFPADLLKMNVQARDHNLDQIADIEYLRDDEIMSTLIPKGYLIVDKASFGTSGAALLQQYKPFGRRVFSRQSIIMREIANDLRMHFALTGKFQGINTEFELEMNFPQIEESHDRIQQKGDTFHLAKDVYDGIKATLGMADDEQLPPVVTKQIFSTLSFLSPKEIDSWIDTTIDWKTKQAQEKARQAQAQAQAKAAQQSKDPNQSFGDDQAGSDDGDEPNVAESIFGSLSEAIQKKLTTKLTEKKIQEIFYDSKKRIGIGEGVTRHGKHFVASWDLGDRSSLHEDLLREISIKTDTGASRLSEAIQVRLPYLPFNESGEWQYH
jgi:hypothetical protein